MPFHVDRYRSIPEAFFAIAERFPERVVYSQALRTPGSGGESAVRTSESRNYREVKRRVASLLKFFHSVRSPQPAAERNAPRVAIISNTRPEWMEADIALLSAGAITVAVYHSLSDEEVAYILFDSGADVVVAENSEQVSKLLRIIERPWKIPGTEDRAQCEARITLRQIIAIEKTAEHPLVKQWDDILSQYDAGDSAPPEFSPAAQNELATLVYTSGTTGPPKGVMQTHKNHLANVRQVYEAGIVEHDSTVFLFLPLAHSFARLMGMIGFLTPVTVYFPAVYSTEHSRLEPRALLADMREMGAHVVPIVPRFLEKMEEAIRSRAARSSIPGRLLRMALSVAEKSYVDRTAHRTSSRAQKLLFRTTAPVRRSIRDSLFGSNFHFAVSGGAKLPVPIARFFQSLEIPVCEGYGLTETCVATNSNPVGRNKIGTVGPVLSQDIEQRVEEDGEICFRGPNVSIGYWQRPTATKAAWDNLGWFHTGDLGSIDADGYLTINGRKKDIIVTSGGKKISPQAIEDQLRAHELVSQAVLVGEGKPFCVAVLTLRTKPPADRLNEIRNVLSDHLLAINKHLASFETVKNFLLLDEDFSLENGLLTPTLKVKRKLVQQRFEKEIEELYKKTKKPETAPAPAR